MRHHLGKGKLVAPHLKDEISKAERFEGNGQWLRAGESYQVIASSIKEDKARRDMAVIVFVRAAACFESATQYRDAAHAYSEAARLLQTGQDAGELYCRAAFNYRAAQQFFTAGSHYRFAADAFAVCTNNIVEIKDPVTPLPMGAYKYLVVGRCFDASCESYIDAKDEAWASGSSWLAGNTYLKQGSNFDAANAFTKALILCIRFYNSLEPESLRSALPLAQEEREQKINPLDRLHEAIQGRYEQSYKSMVGFTDDTWVQRETAKRKISTYYNFYKELRAIGNTKEAQVYYIKRRRSERGYFRYSKRWFQWLAYCLWDVTCEYGENVKRWVLWSLGILLFFTGLYYQFGLVEPVTSWVDYPYFSIVTLTSLGYGDIHPKGDVGKVVACAEIILGLLMFGMLVTLLSKRVASE
jgi:tetratricopeptide (TPR) repeat protein